MGFNVSWRLSRSIGGAKTFTISATPNWLCPVVCALGLGQFPSSTCCLVIISPIFRLIIFPSEHLRLIMLLRSSCVICVILCLGGTSLKLGWYEPLMSLGLLQIYHHATETQAESPVSR